MPRRGRASQARCSAAVGFEILKIVGTYTIANTAHSPTAGPFAGLLAVLIWIQLVARFMLFCAAWSATATPIASPAASLPAVTLTVPGPDAAPSVSPARVAVSIFGAGAAVGVGLVSYLRRGRAR